MFSGKIYWIGMVQIFSVKKGDKIVLFSIIIPVYQAEKVLQRCIDSVLRQTVSDFELILVDDGSKDTSPSVCDRNALLDHRVRVIHQKNGGVSSARNAGLDICCGDRIVFIDSDDYIEFNFLESFISHTEDLLISGYQIEGFGLEKSIYRNFEDLSYSSINKNQTADLFEHGMFNYVWTKAFDGQIIRQNHIRFDQRLNYAEDTLFVLQYMNHCKSVSQICGTPYHYVKYEHETLTGGKLLSEKMIRKIETANDSIANELNHLLGQEFETVTAKRMASLYKEILGILVNHSETPRSFVQFLFKQKWFRETLNYVDQYYTDEAPKFRLLLKAKSGFLFWLYLQTRK